MAKIQNPIKQKTLKQTCKGNKEQHKGAQR